ncbi:MAG: CubicO group peptidase (beta-lactamase class C family), partial [Oleiphilaceae bacterium]
FLIELQLSLLNQSNKLLTAELVEEMLAPTGYGLGFQVWKQDNEISFGHGGANAGFRSLIVAHKTAGIGFVVMTNSDNGNEVISEISSLIKKTEKWPGYN